MLRPTLCYVASAEELACLRYCPDPRLGPFVVTEGGGG